MGILDALSNMTPEQTQGLLAAAAQMSQASNNVRGAPNTMAALAQSGLAYNQSIEQARQRKMLEERQAQQDSMAQASAAQNNELRGMQIAGLKGSQAEQARDVQKQAALSEAARTSYAGGQFDQKGYIEKVMQIDPEYGTKLLKDLAPKPVTYSTNPEILTIKGKPTAVVMGSDGNPKVLDGFGPYNKPAAAGAGGAGKAGAADKPLPTAALKMLVSEEDALATAGSIQSDLSRVKSQIDSGQLDFGPVENLKNQALNAVGMSTQASRNFASFKSTLEKMRNDSLRLNSGVQTDGDAQRAWKELFDNINDRQVVSQRLEEIQQINNRAIRQRQANIGTIQGNYGRQASPASAPPAPSMVPNPISSSGWSIKVKGN